MEEKVRSGAISANFSGILDDYIFSSENDDTGAQEREFCSPAPSAKMNSRERTRYLVKAPEMSPAEQVELARNFVPAVQTPSTATASISN